MLDESDDGSVLVNTSLQEGVEVDQRCPVGRESWVGWPEAGGEA